MHQLINDDDDELRGQGLAIGREKKRKYYTIDWWPSGHLKETDMMWATSKQLVSIINRGIYFCSKQNYHRPAYFATNWSAKRRNISRIRR